MHCVATVCFYKGLNKTSLRKFEEKNKRMYIKGWWWVFFFFPRDAETKQKKQILCVCHQSYMCTNLKIPVSSLQQSTVCFPTGSHFQPLLLRELFRHFSKQLLMLPCTFLLLGVTFDHSVFKTICLCICLSHYMGPSIVQILNFFISPTHGGVL